MRGKQTGVEAANQQVRLIPACAGKTRKSTSQGSRTPAHPRVCGENIGDTLPVKVLEGSSPRVRGKPRIRMNEMMPTRLIPACAGKTRARVIAVSLAWAHPRVCGENCFHAPPAGRASGSSPRVRGKRFGRPVRFRGYGLIPACAGKTSQGIFRSGETWAHPRVCGENIDRNSSSASRAGSSPRVRGKPLRGFFPQPRKGLIPACAGKTDASTTVFSIPRAHPRVCGENPRQAALPQP